MIRRRWFRFSLRAFLAAVTLLCFWLGWLTDSARRQREVVEAIEALGGIVQYDWQPDVSTWKKSNESWGVWGYSPPMRYAPDDADRGTPSWLRKRLGEHLFQDAESVIFCTRLAFYSEDKSRGLIDVSSRELEADLSSAIQAIAPRLRNLPKLKTIYLQEDAKTISDGAEERLKAELPGCRIVREPVITATVYLQKKSPVSK